MKKIVALLAILSFFCWTNAQEQRAWILTEHHQQIVGVQFKNVQLSNDLINNSIDSIKQVFPWSKNDTLLRLFEATISNKQANSLLKNPEIKEIYFIPKAEDYLTYTPSDYMWYYYNPDSTSWLWHLKKIMADYAWDITQGDSSVKIAILDTWFDINHPDLQNQMYCIFDPYDNQPFYSSGTKNNHGTTVASFAAAQTDGGDGLASVGFNCKIIPYKGWAGDYLQRAHHASLVMNADVLTSSAGNWICNREFNELERIAVKEILDNGTVIVMPAGNGINASSQSHCFNSELGIDQPWRPLHPYYDSRIIIVSSTDKSDCHKYMENGIDLTHSHYSDVDICAPGYNIMGASSTLDANGNPVTWPYYGSYAGTSFSTPIVAGVCALIKSVNRCLTPEDVQDIIKQTADPIQDDSLYQGLLGAGRVNAYKAVLLAQTYHNQNDTIGSNIIWSTNSYRGGTLVIDSLTTLTITGTLHCASSARIVVRPGGKLIVDGGTLTNACTGEMWQGIFVEGHSNLHQTEACQGTVLLRNGATIENALCGIHTGAPGDTSTTSTGGIILAEDATFRNCGTAVYMRPYTDYTATGLLKPNASSFYRCTFSVDNAYYGLPGSEVMARLWGVAGVRFGGCTFSLATTPMNTGRGYGIYAEDAGFRVDTYCSQEIMNSDCSCPNQYATLSTFSGFYKAISAVTSGSPYAVTVDEVSFSNNQTGVSISGNNHAAVTRCQFDLSTAPETTSPAAGLELSACTGFLVEGNDFSRSTSSFPTYGIRATGTGTSNNSLYRNTFSGLTYGIHASGVNGGLFTGLRFSCNTFSQDTRDIYVADGQVAVVQGGSTAGADNSFSSGATGNFEVLNPKCQLDYHYSTGGSHSPAVHTNNVQLHPNAIANGCASTLCTGGDPIKGLPEYNVLSAAMNGASADSYDAEDSASVLQEMSDIANDNIRGIEGGDTIDVGALKDWFSEISETWAKYSLAETEYLAGESNALTLQGISVQLDTDEERDEYDNYLAFNALKDALSGDIIGHANWPLATEAQKTELQRIADAGTGRSSVMARGVLCFFFGICYDDEVMADLRRAPAKNGEGYMPVLTDDSLSFSIAFGPLPIVKSDSLYLGAQSILFAGGASDTAIFNNKKYRVFKAVSNVEFTEPGLMMYLREDTTTGQLFRYYPDDDTEVITCDLSLQPGDTFCLSSGNYSCWTVDSVTYEEGRKVVWFPPVALCGGNLLSAQYPYRNCFIEGIGPAFGPFEIVNSGIAYDLGLLLCVHHNDSLVYMTDTVLGCVQYAVSIPGYPDVSMKIYPNPAGNILYVEFEGTDDLQGTLTVTDLTGVVVLTRECHDPVTQLDVSNLTTGLYVVSFRNGKGVVVRKFVKM